MARYHITGRGEPGICRAKKVCPLGDMETEHYATPEAAAKAFEERNSSALFTPSVKSDKSSEERSYELFEAPSADADIYAKELYKLRLANLKTYPYKSSVEAMTKEEKARVVSLAKTLGLKENALLNSVVQDEATWIALVHPQGKKQNYQERALANYLKKENPELTIANLPKGGANSLYLIRGELKRREKVGKQDKLKTIDFLVERDNHSQKAIIIAKHTEGGGGAQDNQYHDVLTTLEEAGDDPDLLVIACLDGDYYRSKDSRGLSRHELLQNLYRLKPTVFIGDYKETSNKLKDFFSGK